jgi:hypothetical protein
VFREDDQACDYSDRSAGQPTVRLVLSFWLTRSFQSRRNLKPAQSGSSCGLRRLVTTFRNARRSYFHSRDTPKPDIRIDENPGSVPLRARSPQIDEEISTFVSTPVTGNRIPLAGSAARKDVPVRSRRYTGGQARRAGSHNSILPCLTVLSKLRPPRTDCVIRRARYIADDAAFDQDCACKCPFAMKRRRLAGKRERAPVTSDQVKI